MTMHVRESGTSDAARFELGDGRRIHGFVEAGYGGVMDAFIANFARRHDVGAACASTSTEGVWLTSGEGSPTREPGDPGSVTRWP